MIEEEKEGRGKKREKLDIKSFQFLFF